jgi:hypothetical protein
MVMAIEVSVAPGRLNWAQLTAAAVSSVGPEAVVQLTTRVAAETEPHPTAQATANVTSRGATFDSRDIGYDL